MKKMIIAASAHIFPKSVLTSDAVESLIDEKSDYTPTQGIIASIAGIKNRHVSSENEYNSTLAYKAAQKLFKKYPIHRKSEVDLLIFAAAGQDILEPATAHIVQHELGTSCPVFDVTNACNSFLNALEIASAFIQNGTYKKILIATGEVPTKCAKYTVTDRNDFKQSFPGYTFGDVGTAVIVEPAPDKSSGLLAIECGAESSHWDKAMLPGGGSRFRNSDDIYFRGDGHELKTAFDTIGPNFIKQFLHKNCYEVSDINHVFVHQVSKPYLDMLQESCNFTDAQIEETVSWCGNVAAATLPLGWSLREENNQLHTGDLVLMIGLAGGISLGCALIRV